MITRAIDSNHDWTFGKGQEDYLSNVNAVAQNIQTRLLCFLGDCFFDSGAGIDWYSLIQQKNEAALVLAITSQISNTEGVSQVLEVSFNVDNNRNATIQYEVVTVYSQNQTLSGSVPLAVGV